MVSREFVQLRVEIGRHQRMEMNHDALQVGRTVQQFVLDLLGDWWASRTFSSGATRIGATASIRCSPSGREPDPPRVHPKRCRRPKHRVDDLGIDPSISRWAIDFIELSRMPKIAAAMSRPTIASARGKPSHTPTTRRRRRSR